MQLLLFLQICALSTASNAKYTWDSEHKVPYLVVGNQWIGYDDERSIKLKVTATIRKQLRMEGHITSLKFSYAY